MLDSLDKCISPCPVVIGKLPSFIRFRKCPGRNLFTEISYLERFTKNPEKKFERTGLIDPARGGTILLRFQVSSVVRNDQSTDEISSEEPYSFTTIRFTKVTQALRALPSLIVNNEKLES